MSGVDLGMISGVYLPAMFFVGVGPYSLLARSWLARLTVKWNYKVLRVRVDERDVEISAMVGGAAFIAIGVLMLVGIIQIP